MIMTTITTTTTASTAKTSGALTSTTTTTTNASASPCSFFASLPFRWSRRSGLTFIYIAVAVHTLFTWYQILQHDAVIKTSSTTSLASILLLAKQQLDQHHQNQNHHNHKDDNDHGNGRVQQMPRREKEQPPKSWSSSSSNDSYYRSYDFAKDLNNDDDDDDDSVVVFYNIYLPTKEQELEEQQRQAEANKNNQEGDNAARNQAQQHQSSGEDNNNNEEILDAPTIFRNQITQIQLYASRREQATTMNGIKRRAPLKVYYNTIGQEGGLTEEAKVICQARNLDCIHMHHYPNGQEDVTLQSLYEYCQQQQQPASGDSPRYRRVAYLHAKGSYHKTLYNNHNRVTVTFSVLNKCLDMLGTRYSNGTRVEAGREDRDTATTTTCDACGGMFLPIWGPFFSTNMWAAECTYINQLIPPRDFGRRMEELDQTLWGGSSSDGANETSRAKTSSSPLLQRRLLDNIGPYCMGTGRYSNEHWVASHPSLRPCDARGVRMGTPMAPRSTLAETIPQWRLLNSRRLKQFLSIPNENGNTIDPIRREQAKKIRLREYFLLPGYLFRSAFLYRSLPPSQSWAWSWFPDGTFWKGKAQQYGLEVVHAVLNSSSAFIAAAA